MKRPPDRKFLAAALVLAAAAACLVPRLVPGATDAPAAWLLGAAAAKGG